MLGVRLDQETELRLEHLCEKTGHSKSYYAKKAIREFLDDREDYLLGLAALGKKEATISLKKLEKDLGLDD
jgi:RHH-type transcriptional regulator, rel operon repressor / antitoxin RelB